MPSIHFPKRKPKPEGSNTSKINVASVEGTLRALEEKDLLLQTSANRVLRFRLIAKTEFRDKDARPMRDSLLHPGDHVTVEANPGDPETAIHVILVRAGSKSDREEAAVPVEQASIVIPSAGDLGRPHSSVDHESAGSESAGETASVPSEAPQPSSTTSEPAPNGGGEERPTLRHKDGQSSDEQSHSDSSLPPLPEVIGDPVINAAREAAESFTADLPNFLVQQATTRYQGSGKPTNWRALDVVTCDVASVNGKEEYKNVKINGRPTSGPVENTGSWSTGEFTITLQDIMSPATAAVFTKRGEDRIAGRPALVYDLAVEKPNSHWIIQSPDHRQYQPAYKGSIWIDKETQRILRIEQQAVSMPRNFTYDKAETVLEYGFVTIEGKKYLLPVTSENLGCQTGTRDCSRNVIAFRNYRKFTAESNLTFDK